MSLNYAVTLELIDKMTAPVRSLASAFDTLKGKAASFQAQAAQIQADFDKTLNRSANLTIVGAGAMAVGKRMSDALQQPLDVAMQFEATMSKVQALTRLDIKDDGQRAKLDALREQAKLLGNTTSFSASQAADAQSFLAMAGFDPEKIMTSMPGMLSLAKAGGTELARTADIASNVLSGFSLNADQMTRLSDVMAYTFSSSNVNMEMLGETMKYVAPVASKAGASLEQVAAMSGMLGDVGIQGSMAGTALRAAFIRMADPPKEAAKALNALGVSAKDSRGNMREVTDVMLDLNRSMGSLPNGKKLEYISSIFGAEAAAAMMELVSNAEKLDSRFKEIDSSAGGAAERIAQVMGENIQGTKTEMLSALEGLYITIGEMLLPTVKAAYEKMTKFIRLIQTWISEHRDLAKVILIIMLKVGGAITAMGAGVIALGSINTALGGLRFGLQNVLIRLSLLRVIGLTAFAGIAYGVKHWRDLLSILGVSEERIGKIKSALTMLSDAWKKAFGDKQTKPPDLLDKFKQTKPPDWLDKFKQTSSDGSQFASPLIKQFEQMRVIKKGDTLWGIADELYGAGQRYQEIADLNKGIITDANKIFTGQSIKVKTGEVAASSAIPDWMKPKSQPQNTEQSALPSVPSVPTEIERLANSGIMQTIQQFSLLAFDVDPLEKYGQAAKWLVTIFDSVTQKIEDQWQPIKAVLVGALAAVKTWFDGNGDTLLQMAQNVASGIIPLLVLGPARALAGATSLWGNAFGYMQSHFPQLKASAKEAFGALSQSVSTMQAYLPRLLAAAGATFGGIGQWLQTNSAAFQHVLSGVAIAAVSRLTAWFEALAVMARNGSLTAWLDDVAAAVPTVVRAVSEFASGLWSSIKAVTRFSIGFVEFIGGWKVFAGIFAGGYLIATLSGFIQGLAALGGIIAALFSPIGMIVVLIAGLVIGVRYLVLYWDQMSLAGRALGVVLVGIGAAILGYVAYLKLAALWTAFQLTPLGAWIAGLSLASVWAGISAAATWVMTAATSAFGVAMAVVTSPITLVVAAIAALAAGAYYLYTNWATVKAYLSETTWGQMLLSAINMILSPVQTFNAAVSYLQGLWASTKASLSETTWGQMLLSAINMILSPVQTFNAAVSYLQGLWASTKASLSETTWGQMLLSAINMILSPVQTFNAAVSYLQGLWASTKASLSETTWGQMLLSAINMILSPVQTFNSAVAYLQGLWASTKASLSETTWGQMILGAINLLLAPLDMFKAIIAALTGAWNGAKAALGDGAWGQALMGTISMVMAGFEKLKAGFVAVKNMVSEKISVGVDYVKSAVGMETSGARAFGGGVDAGKMYRVNEYGDELIQRGNKTFLMSGAAGQVVPMNKMQRETPYAAPSGFQTVPQKAAMAQQSASRSEVDVRIISDKPVRVERMRSDGDTTLNVNTGRMMESL